MSLEFFFLVIKMWVPAHLEWLASLLIKISLGVARNVCLEEFEIVASLGLLRIFLIIICSKQLN